MSKYFLSVVVFALSIFAWSATSHEDTGSPAHVAVSRPAPSKHSIREMADARLESLLANHPVPEVREEFTDLIRSGQIALDYSATSSNASEFKVLLPDSAPGALRDRNGYVMALSISTDLLLSRERNGAWWTLVLYHEYIHFTQYRDARLSIETFLPVDLRIHPDKVESVCTNKWYAEEEAYHKECELAQLLGKTEMLGTLCRGLNDGRFTTDLVEALLQGDSSASLCHEVFMAKGKGR